MKREKGKNREKNKKFTWQKSNYEKKRDVFK